jgi:hypothetical protein
MEVYNINAYLSPSPQEQQPLKLEGLRKITEKLELAQSWIRKALILNNVKAFTAKENCRKRTFWRKHLSYRNK